MVDREKPIKPRRSKDLKQVVAKMHGLIDEITKPEKIKHDPVRFRSNDREEAADPLLNRLFLYYLYQQNGDAKYETVTEAISGIARNLESLHPNGKVQIPVLPAPWEAAPGEEATVLEVRLKTIRRVIETDKNTPRDMITFLEKCDKIDELSQQVAMGSREESVIKM